MILDFNLPGQLNGLEVLEQIRAFDSGIKVIMVTGQGNVRLAVDAMKTGAYDYLSKPIVLSELKLLLDRSIGQRRTEGQLSYFHEKQAIKSDIEQIIGHCPAIRLVKGQIASITQAGRHLSDGVPSSVLITGENGTGKELVARALHFGGPRNKQPFVKLNAATTDPQQLESELFGHEKGAFAEADERKLGLVEAAEGGTLFLDEVGALDLLLQTKLLKLIQERKFCRLGSLRDMAVDIQIIMASNHSLRDMAAAGRFREDLFRHLNDLTIHVPPLRERGSDILLLARHFLEVCGRKYAKPARHLSDAACHALMQYHWPDNIREIRNRVEQAVLLSEGPELDQTHFALPDTDASVEAQADTTMTR